MFLSCSVFFFLMYFLLMFEFESCFCLILRLMIYTFSRERKYRFSCLYGILCADLDFATIMEEATGRWLRPNEIHAILSNNKYFTILVKPVNLPKSNCLLLVVVEWFFFLEFNSFFLFRFILIKALEWFCENTFCDWYKCLLCMWQHKKHLEWHSNLLEECE